MNVGRSLKLFSVRGVDVRLHITFPLILIFAAVQFGLLAGSAAGAFFGLGAIVILFALVTLHELGHTFAAQRYGIEVKQIVLSPLGGVAQLREMPERPAQELVIALAGPAVNVIAAVLMGVTAALFGWGLPELRAALPTAGDFGLLSLFNYIFITNLFLAAFNLLPAFPLDGGRVLRALLALRLDYVRATSLAATVGRLAAIGLGLYGFLSGNLFTMLVAFFIFTAAGQEAGYVRYRRLLHGYTVGHAYSPAAYRLEPATTMRSASDLMLLGGQSSFAVVEDGRLLGFLPAANLTLALRTQRPFVPVSDVMRRDVAPLTPETPLFDAERRLAEEGLNALPVAAEGHYLGLLTVEQIAALRRALLAAPRVAPQPATAPSAH
jgi:stage IV sporulation protein FB